MPLHQFAPFSLIFNEGFHPKFCKFGNVLDILVFANTVNLQSGCFQVLALKPDVPN